MSKYLRKQKRKTKLCLKKTYTLERTLSKEAREEIEEWCEENLTGSCMWLRTGWNDSNTMGFQDLYDKMAFILRWA